MTPTPALPVDGEGVRLSLPMNREGVMLSRRPHLHPHMSPRPRGDYRGGLFPIERLQPGDLVYGHDGKPQRVLRVIRKPHRGRMIGIRQALCPEALWLTADHRVLAKPRPGTLGGQRDWSATPIEHLERRRELRKEASLAEQKLWTALRNKRLDFKFRRQHPIGPYIADFYSREAHLIVEVDGSTHYTPEAIEYDAQRDAYMRALGLDVLRFTTREVEQNLEGVWLAIQNQCRLRTESLEGAKWVQAGMLQPGDLVFVGPERRTVPVESVECVYAEEEVYDIEVEGAHSFVTEVCIVHNCGSVLIQMHSMEFHCEPEGRGMTIYKHLVR